MELYKKIEAYRNYMRARKAWGDKKDMPEAKSHLSNVSKQLQIDDCLNKVGILDIAGLMMGCRGIAFIYHISPLLTSAAIQLSEAEAEKFAAWLPSKTMIPATTYPVMEVKNALGSSVQVRCSHLAGTALLVLGSLKEPQFINFVTAVSNKVGHSFNHAQERLALSVSQSCFAYQIDFLILDKDNHIIHKIEWSQLDCPDSSNYLPDLDRVLSSLLKLGALSIHHNENSMSPIERVEFDMDVHEKLF